MPISRYTSKATMPRSIRSTAPSSTKATCRWIKVRLRVNANRLVIEYEDRKVVRITAHGTPARYQQQLEDDQGLVKAHAQTIVYHTEDDLVDLKGEASLTQQGSELTGALITYDIVLGKVEASAGQNGRVQTVFKPAGGS